MNKKLPLLAAGLVAGLIVNTYVLRAQNAPASTPAAPAAAAPSTAPAPAMATPAEKPAFKPDLSKLPAPSDKKGVTFDADIAPILKVSCAGCHGDNRPKSGLSLTSLDGALKGGKQAGKAVVAGHSDQSLVVLYAADLVPKSEMPPKSARNRTPPTPALTTDQIALVRAWIDQGAK